ncbi:MAG: F0F1 ATP synthase subunit A [Deltaproteobacteria bacterium]|nr:F0F1 ATP synthase subunit A [Deltaproteobacteria bacterium]
MHEHEPFTWLSKIPGLEHAPNHLVTAVLVAVFLVVCGVAATALAKAAGDTTIPEGRLSFRNFFEIVAEKLYALCESVMGEHAAEAYFPVIGTLFMFIFTCNLIGLIPGFLPPTDNINVTLAAGLFVFIYYNFHGIKANGIGYLKHFLGPVWYLAPLMLVIELVSHVFRPISLALRLRGNMMGDHAVLGVFLSLVPYVVPVIFYALGVFVAVVQAFVFCLLTMVYINLSTAHDH